MCFGAAAADPGRLVGAMGMGVTSTCFTCMQLSWCMRLLAEGIWLSRAAVIWLVGTWSSSLVGFWTRMRWSTLLEAVAIGCWLRLLLPAQLAEWDRARAAAPCCMLMQSCNQHSQKPQCRSVATEPLTLGMPVAICCALALAVEHLMAGEVETSGAPHSTVGTCCSSVRACLAAACGVLGGEWAACWVEEWVCGSVGNATLLFR
jgi:hypothetical protein